MATLTDLAIRTLQKLQVLGQDEQASPADLEKAKTLVMGVHSFLQAEGLLRWTLSSIEKYAEEPYVLMAAYNGAPDFQVERDPEGWMRGLKMIQSAVHLPAVSPIYVEHF